VVGEQYRVVRLIRLIRTFLGPDWQPAWLWLTAAGEPPASLQRFVGGCAIRGGRPCCEIPIPLRFAPSPMPTAAGGLLGAMVGASSPPPAQGDWLERLKGVVASYLPHGGLTVEEMAELARMTPRTLQRLLADRGTTYRDVLDGVRVDRARQLLAADELTMAEVAHAAGYTDSSNFARAFRRLCGRSPAQYRADQRLLD
jgi:AraC-like DNA-binding protein